MKVTVVIPAYNEERRIGKTLEKYGAYFEQKAHNNEMQGELLVVLNGCTDATEQVVAHQQKRFPFIRMITAAKAGKGLALIEGFKDALTRDNDYIGFVDADMATAPQAYDQLLKEVQGYDGVIASRYIKGAQIFPQRPLIKEWGRRLFFNSTQRLILGLNYQDTQCGAKLFKASVLERLVPLLCIEQWAFDVELLYLCKQKGFTIKEVPTVWHDQDNSKLRVFQAGLPMLGSLFKVRWRHGSL